MKQEVMSKYVKHPGEVWVSGSIYVGDRKNPMYLALVTDAYSKKILLWKSVQ